jgi:nitroimidazol reductase NimA-like FMN-containing flavoprotein (pyridoxamine 5'-phosphate oxidase superfamily)
MTAFRDIRRSDRALTEDRAREILQRAEYGVLATVGADGWPYAVPVNHVLSGDVLYIHCALEGHKLENIAHEERVSFAAVGKVTVLPAKLSTLYESAIVFGRAAPVTDPAEKRRALELLAVRFCGAVSPEAEQAIATSGPRTAVVRVRLERIAGKAHTLKRNTT